MSAPGTSTPAWLFSFVDLAFLLLIAMTQLGSNDVLPELGEVRVPKLHSESQAGLPEQADERWQLRVHPRSDDGEAPFELFASAAPQADRLDREGLRERLAALKDQASARPLLAPHRESRSEDLLEAANALEDLWPGRRRATFEPLVAAR